MTGRELIVYIMENHLEDTKMIEGRNIIGFMSEEEAAVKFGVGEGTIRAWINMGAIEGLNINYSVYIPANTVDPRLSGKLI